MKILVIFKTIISTYLLFIQSLLYAENLTDAVIDLDNGLVAYYPFNGNANDESGNGHHGTLFRGVNLIEDKEGNQSYNFDGTDDHIEIEHHASLNLDTFTVTFWAYRDFDLRQQLIIAKGDLNEDGFSFLSGGQTFRLNSLNINLNTKFPTKQWVFVVGSVDSYSGKMRFYINSELVGEKDIGDYTISNNLPLTIGIAYSSTGYAGSLYTYGYPFDGKLDNIRVYNRALSQSEIIYLYEIENKDLVYIQPGLTTKEIFTTVDSDETPFNYDVIDLTNESEKYLFLVDIDGDNDQDLFTGGKYINFYENIGSQSTPKFNKDIIFSSIQPNIKNTSAVNVPIFVDIDNDGDFDLFNRLYFYENTGTNIKYNFEQRTGDENPIEKLNFGENVRIILQNENTEPDEIPDIISSHKIQFADIDNDKDFDLISTTFLGSKGSIVILYENIGDKNFSKFEKRLNSSFSKIIKNIKFPNNSYYLNLLFFDIDIDGDLDIFTQDYDHIFLIENIGTPENAEFQINHSKNPFYGLKVNYNDFADLDNDAAPDVIVIGSSKSRPNKSIYFYKNIHFKGNPIPNAGNFTTSQQLDIRCFGCQTIHYTLDGSIPTQDSPAFQTLIDLSQDTSLKFIIVDAEDNVGTVESAEYIIDLKKPELSIQFPTENSIIENIYEFKGTALDPKTSSGSGIERLELTVTNGDFYLTNDPENPLSTTPALLNIIHTGDNWTHKLVTDTLPSGHYTIEARLYDKLGNESQEMVNFMIGKPIFTTLTLDTDKSKILQKDTISITGKLRYFPASQDIDLSGLPILLNITDPDGIQQPPQILHTDAYGNYAPTDIDSFHKAGSYSLQTAFMGQDFFVEAHTKTSHVFVGQSAGYAMLVQGRVSNNEGMEAYNKSLNRIYRTLLDREFTAQDIIYFNYNVEQEGVDARPSKTNIQNHLGKIQTYLNEVAAPFYLLMLDHGSYERFMLGEEEISPQELNAWLTELEAGLNPAALAQPRIIILGACFSGSFISELSKPGRIIISSAAEDEYSYKGLHEADGIRSGEYFIDSLFQFLGKGLNIKTAFTQATQATEHFTHHRSLSANAQNRFNDSAVQHPLLDDNGDAKGSNTFYLNQDEGKYAETVILGAGADYDVSFDGNPAEIQAINDTLFLSSTDTEGPLWLTVNDMRKVEKALIEIRKPADIASLTQRPNATGQSILMLEKRFLSPNLDTNRYEVTYKEFIEPGRYDIFYYVQDATTYKNDPVTGQVIYAGDISTAWQGVVYKNKVNNNPPNLFNLTSPKDNAEIPSFALFDWESSVDPDGNKLTYTLLISDMEDFSSPVYQQTLLDISATIVTDAAQLQDGKNYYWQVWAVDAFGAKMESQIRQFTINNPSVPPGGLSPSIEGDFNLNSSVTLTPVHNVQQTTQDGKQLFVAPAGEYQASFTNGIGETQTIPVTLQSDVVTQVNLWAGQATASFNFSDLSLTIPLIRIDMPHPHWFAADFVYTGTGFVLRNVNPVKPNNILSYVPLDLADINLVSIVKILDRPGLPLYRLGLSLLPESSSDFHFEITMLEPIALQ